ncbi:MAG: sulfate adenylyltransferase subunit CysN [Gammaproteobacteria bacterium]|nr:sulfate adenylyltransferase subunit CysN [Gammaproteobacteria bacterium]
MTIKNDDMELLRLVTVGSVDDGKSTLIGRLLVDTKGAFEDQLMAVRKNNDNVNEGDVVEGKDIDLARLTDGLQAEREQGITIDVAYRYFSTPKRKFIMADCPGHEQYTRNMVTGASTASAAIILVDARKGVLTQSRRHTHIIGLLGLSHLIVAVNKMDLVDYAEEVFERIKAELSDFCAQQNIHDLICIPISALEGDMVVERGDKMPWYKGHTVLETLESLEVSDQIDTRSFRFPVQYVNRPQSDELHDFRGYAGRVVSGTVKTGDEVQVLPSGHTTRIKEIVTFDGNLAEAFAPQSVTLTLEDEIDISRGNMIVHSDQLPTTADEFAATICWMGDEPLSLRKKYFIKQTTNTVRAVVTEICYRTDTNTLEHLTDIDQLSMNEIGKIKLKLLSPLTYDSYADNHATGSFIIIDAFTNNTVAAGMIAKS